MNEDLIDLLRRLENMIRIGTIIDVDLSGEIPLYRVETGELETDWIAATTQRAGTAKKSHPYTISEQVVLMAPSGDMGAAMISHALNSDANPSPDNHQTRDRTTYPDGAVIEYNPESGELKAAGIKTATIQASVLVTIDSPESKFTGNVEIDGNALVKQVLTYKGGLTNGDSGASTTIKGNIDHSDGDLRSNGIVVHSHHHSGVEAGSAESGDPV
jgi:phage baseplate assembly protein V